MLSMALHTGYWVALSEWLSGAVSIGALREKRWREAGRDGRVRDGTVQEGRWTVTPPVLTVLTKWHMLV